MKIARILILALIVTLAGCRDHEETLPPELQDLFQLEIKRPLEVVFVSPQGDTTGPADYSSITVVFNQPMKALSAEAPKLKEPFKLEPPVKGRFRWKGTATVSFEPEEPLKFGAEYKIIVPAGIQAAGGAKLAAEASYEFTTPGPRLVTTIPKDGKTHWRTEEPLFWVFDQAIDPTKVSQLLSLDKGGQPKVRALTDEELSKLNKDREKKYVGDRMVAIELPSSLTPDTRYYLKLESGLQGKEGPRTSSKVYKRKLTTLGPLEFHPRSQKERAYPNRSVRFSFSNQVNAKDLKEHLSVVPKVEIPVHKYDETDSWGSHSLYLSLQPNTTYTFTIDGALKDKYGQTLGKDVKQVWKTGDRYPTAQIADGIAVLEAEGELSIPMGLRNIDTLTYRLAVLDREELLRVFRRSSNSHWLWGSKPYTPPGGFDVVKTVRPKGPRNEIYDRPLDLTPALKSRKHGWVYYQVESKSGKRTFNRRGLAQVTNLAVTGKFSPENSLIMASSLDKAEPLEGVVTTLVDHKGRPVWRGKTDGDGQVKAPGWSKLLGVHAESYDYSLPPLVAFLKKGEDEVFVRNGGFGGLSPWQFDIPFRWSSSAHLLTAEIYSERGLYRPGEEVHLKGALRDRTGGEWIVPDLDKLEFVVTDSRDQELEKGVVDFSEFGTFHHTVKLPPKSPTGSYRVNYKLTEKVSKSWGVDRGLRGISFRVEEFQPAQFEVDVESQAKNLIMGDEVDFEVVGNWLFGAPMISQEVKWSTRIQPFRYRSEDYPGFDFGPGYSRDSEDHGKSLSEGTGITDSSGRLKAEASLKGIPYRGDGQLVIEGTIQSANRRSITGRLALPVSRGEYRVGIKPASRFVPAQPLNVSFVTLNPAGKSVSKKDITVELVRREWNSVRKSDVDGRFRWVTEVEDKVVQTLKLSTESKATTTKLKPSEAGYYVIRATATDSKANKILSESSFYAHGTGYVPWGRSDDDSIELVADKPKYSPGDTAKILIKSPFEEATALVTYERDLILHSYTTKLTGSAPVIEVPLTEDHLPNLYVSVMLFRGRIQPEAGSEDQDVGKPSFKIGYLDLPVAPDSQRLKVELTTDAERYGPKDEVVTKLKVTDSKGQPVEAELSLTAADVGVLNLINYQTPDLFDTFFGSLALAVRTAESRLDVIGQRSYGTKGEDEGGGGGYNPGFRSDFRLTAVWEPQVRTDKNGEAEVRFTLPENLTTFRVMATAVTKDTRCGSADTEIILTKPLILKPSTPSFARIGDDFKAGVLVANGSQKGHSVTITMEADGIELKAKPKNLFLKAGEDREVLFDLKATEEGVATLRFSGVMGDDKDGVQYEIPLQRTTQRVNLAHTGSTTESTLDQQLIVPTTAAEGSAKVEVRLSSTILLGLEDSVKALLDYPYGCLEQRTSRITPMLLTDDLVTRFELEGWDQDKVHKSIQENLDLIPGYVGDNGGLKIWPDSSSTHPYLTARVVTVAHMAKQRGYKIKGQWCPKARSYLKGYLDGNNSSGYVYSENEVLTTKAYALAALTRWGFKGKPYLNSLMDRRTKMSAVGRAHLLEAAHRLGAKEAVELLSQELVNSVKIENATAYFDVDESTLPWLFSNDVRDTGLILAALLNTGSEFPISDKVVSWLLEARNRGGNWGSTANNAAALTGLVAYSKVFEGEDPSFEVDAKLDGKSMGAAKLTLSQAKAELENALKNGSKSQLQLKKEGEGRLYYNIALSYKDTKPSPPVDEGMTVLRSLVDLDGKPVRQAKGGKIYKVQLSVIAPQLRRYVVLRDPIPAGFEVVKTDFATESDKLSQLLKRGGQPSWMTFFRFEDYADRILLFADALAPGEHTYEYLVRAQTPGKYLYPAAQVEEMYHPELFGRTGTSTLVVK